MDYEQVKKIVGNELANIMPTIGWAGAVPYVTGRLHSSIKLKPTPTGFDIIIDTGSLTLEEWNDLQRIGAADNLPMGFAPYAGKVNNRNPYWRRVAMAVQDRLKLALGDSGPTRYDAGTNARGGNNE